MDDTAMYELMRKISIWTIVVAMVITICLSAIFKYVSDNDTTETNAIEIEKEVAVKEKKEEVCSTGTFMTTYSYYVYVRIDDNTEDQRVRVPEAYYEGLIRMTQR